MGENIAFENGCISDFWGLVTLTLDRVILHTVMHHSLTSTYKPNFIEIEETFLDRRRTPTYCQLQSHVTQKLGQKSKIWPRYALGIVPYLKNPWYLPASLWIGEEIAFENGRIFDFRGLVTLTLDRVILHTVMHHSSTPTYIPNFIEIEGTFCARTDGHLRPTVLELKRLRKLVVKRF